mgnify:CR=1 FL=1
MTEDYIIHYSQDALNDLREIYSYISNKLLQTENAESQINKIRKGICSLEFISKLTLSSIMLKSK